MREKEFQDIVENWLRNKFPNSHIYKEVYLDRSERFVDFVVEFGDFRIMVEVENSADDVQSGVMQAQMYAYEDVNSSSMVIYPSNTGSVDEEVAKAIPTVSIVSISDNYE